MLWQRLKASSCFILALGLLAALAAPMSAATISYGTFGPVPPGIMFTDVEESSGTDAVPLYGPPDPFSVGLDFDPASFVATASGGDEDTTDGQLNFTVMGTPLASIDQIRLFEAGDYSLVGVGTAATQALAGVIIRAAVTQVNGLPVSPIDLTPVNASVGFNLAANSGVVQPWSLNAVLNVAGQLGPNQRATKIEVVVDDTLLALSEPASISFIAKKEFRVTIIPNVIPEPASALILLSGCLAIGLVTRRK